MRNCDRHPNWINSKHQYYDLWWPFSTTECDDYRSAVEERCTTDDWWPFQPKGCPERCDLPPHEYEYRHTVCARPEVYWVFRLNGCWS